MFRFDLKKNLNTVLIPLVAVILLGASCEPEQETAQAKPAAPAHIQAVVARQSPRVRVVIDQAYDYLVKGDFESAGRLLDGYSGPVSPEVQGFKAVIDEYKAVDNARRILKSEAYDEQIAELQKLSEKPRPDDVIDANEIATIFTTIIKASEFANDRQKSYLLRKPFVQKAVDTAKEKAADFDEEGNWVDAYAYGYYWLTAFDEDNKEYEDTADKLIEKAAIELRLKEQTCSDSIAPWYEGIKPEMFIRAVQMLDPYYVSVIDYNSMAEHGIKRLMLLGEVIEKGSDELDIEAKVSELHRWAAGLDIIYDELQGPFASVTRDKFTDLFKDAIALNTITIDIPQEVIVAQFAEASLKSLDPYTTLVWPEQIKEFQKSMTQQFSGIGIEISKATGVLKIMSLLPNTPAYTSGLDADDDILKVNGEPTDDMSILCAVSKITGPKGTDVTLTVKHEGSEETEDITITRGVIEVPPTRGWQRTDDGQWRFLIDPENRIGYIRVTAFTEKTVPDLEEVLDTLEKDSLNGLILDLRFNSGGYLTSASKMVDLFVKDGLIVKSQPRYGFSTVEMAHRLGTHPDYPIVVLINGQSASASEIVAGALQDKSVNRATLVGSRTYGKGSVQIITGYTEGGSQLKYTMAYYYLPSEQRVKNRDVMEKLGRTDWGIAPDVEVELLLNEMRILSEVQRDNDVLTKADHDLESQPVERHSLAETLEADPQLAIGLLVVKSKILYEGGRLKFHIKTAKSNIGKGAANN